MLTADQLDTLIDAENPVLWPREQLRYTRQYDLDAWADGRKVYIVDTLDPIAIPDDPTWNEDPYDSRSWFVYYTSLGWLFAAENAYKKGAFPEFVSYAKDIILDFFQDHPNEPGQEANLPRRDLAWHDGGNAFRLSTITFLYNEYFRPGSATAPTFTAAETALFADGLDDAVRQVLYEIGRLNSDGTPYWDGSNHRFFHAMALASYASVFGSLPEDHPFFEEDARALMAVGVTTVQEILSSIMSVETGVTLEQSLVYHRLDIDLATDAYAAFGDFEVADGLLVSELIAKAVEFDLMSRRPGQGYERVSEIGDAAYGSYAADTTVNEAIALGIETGTETATTRFLRTRGVEGTRPEDVTNYVDYIVMRPEFAWENTRDLRVLMDVSVVKARASHGHYDNTNFIVSAYGQNILVDSGGPYSYDDAPGDTGLGTNPNEGPREGYFQTSEAHNVLVIDGMNQADGTSSTIVNRTVDADGYSFVSAKHLGYAGFVVTRNLFVADDGVIISFDHAGSTTNDGSLHDFELNWHFAPNAVGVEAAAAFDFTLVTTNSLGEERTPAQVDVATVTGGTATRAVVEGRTGSDPQGFVATGAYLLETAPVLEIIQEDRADAWFVSAFNPSNSMSATLAFGAGRTDTGFEAVAATRAARYFVTTTITGGVLVTQDVVDATDRTNTGTDGVDSIVGSASTLVADWMFGGLGDDVLRGGRGDDLLVGGEGRDTLSGEADNDSLWGGLGDDRLDGGEGSDTIFGGAGNDFVIGGAGNDTARGDAGNDQLLGGDGADLIRGDAGNDILEGGLGNDRIYGDAGTDIARFAGNRADFRVVARTGFHTVIDLNLTDGDQGTDYLYGIETLRFTDGDVPLI